MPNAIKYNVSTETLALKKGNFWIGTGDVGKGPTSSTGYYNGITPPAGGFTIYLNKETSGPSIYTVNTEAQLTGLTSTIAGVPYTTSGQCLNWFATQNDKMVFNIDYPAIVTDGLVLNLDAGFTPSYPTTNIYFSDLSGSVTYSIKNIGIPLNQWVVRRSDITEITDNSIIPPFYGAQIWSSTINTAVYANTLHRTWNDGSVNGVIGNLGQGFYRYYMWVRGKSTNSSTATISIDISDGGGFANSGNVLIGTNEEWKLISTWDNGSTYNATKFFDYFLTGSNGDTYYISSIAIIRSDVEDPINLKTLYTFPGYINYGGVTTSGLQGLLTNGPTYSSTDGGGIVFDGIDDYINLGGSTSLWTSDFSICFWTKLNIVANQFMFSSGPYEHSASAGTNIWFGGGGNNNFAIHFKRSDTITMIGYNFTLLNSYLNTNQYVITFTNSNRVLSVYQNNSLVGSYTVLSTAITNNSPYGWRIGNTSNAYNVNGNVYNFNVYNKSLSQEEILQNYNAQKGRFGL
jgi:hypothetical protein